MGQWVMGHGSNGSPFLDGSRGSRVTALDPLTHDDEITAQWLAKNASHCNFLFLVDIKKLLTHSIMSYHSWGLNFNLRFFCSQDRQDCPVPPCHVPPCPIGTGNDHGSRIMDHVGRGSTV